MITVIGLGYVGLTTAVVLAQQGFKTSCTDIDSSKVGKLNQGVLPFYEPQLDTAVRNVVHKNLLSFSTDNVLSVSQSSVTFICVGTPPLSDGSTDLTSIKAAVMDVGKGLRESPNYHLVVVKSTIPPGTTEHTILPQVTIHSGKMVGRDFGVCMNPEFLREGHALHDSEQPDRIVIGAYDQKSGDTLSELYRHFACPTIRCDLNTAELIKYAANCFLATKISFSNEFARICEHFNVDVYEVMHAVGLDFRINPLFLRAGVGFGGSCFPKDVNAMRALAKRVGVTTPVLDSVLDTNDFQPFHLIELVKRAAGPLAGKTIAVLGLAFKPNTDDVRFSRAIPIVRALLAEKASVRAYDPMAIDAFRASTGFPIEYYSDWEAALHNADLAIIQTEWQEIRDIQAEDFKRLLRKPIVVDGRRTFDPTRMIAQGIRYYGIGWKNLRH